jgi:hypothetical protein
MVLKSAEIKRLARDAISHFWQTRGKQQSTQNARGSADQGARGAVTGGAQMNGLIAALSKLVRSAGISDASIFTKRNVDLPGYFRPTKKWDILVVVDGNLLAVIEAKSQVGSFGNNFNNRTEEAIGSATDLWTAYREGGFGHSPRPWLGYLFLLEDCQASRSPVDVTESHFPVLREFHGASYQRRYEILLRKLVLERHYDAAAFLISDKTTGHKGEHQEPSDDLRFEGFARSLVAHVGAFSTSGDSPAKDG